MVKHCVVCGEVATTKCGGCKVTPYCSSEHQKVVYKYHKQNCKLLDSNSKVIYQTPLTEFESITSLGLEPKIPNDPLNDIPKSFLKINNKYRYLFEGATSTEEVLQIRTKELNSMSPKERNHILVQIRAGTKLNEIGLNHLQEIKKQNSIPFYRLAALQIFTEDYDPNPLAEELLQLFFTYFCLVNLFTKNRLEEFKYRDFWMKKILIFSQQLLDSTYSAGMALSSYCDFVQEIHVGTQKLLLERVSDQKEYDKLWKTFDNQVVWQAMDVDMYSKMYKNS